MTHAKKKCARKRASAVTASVAGDVSSPNAPAAGNMILRGDSVALDTDVGHEFVIDCARHIEGLLSEANLKTKWGLTDAGWGALATNTYLLDFVRRQRERRIVNGLAAREGAQQEFAKAPSVLGSILNDETISPRHRIEAARELRQAAADGDTTETLEKEKFVVVINLGADEKPFRFETEIKHRAPSVIDDGEEA
jgi:hypothetical protein